MPDEVSISTVHKALPIITPLRFVIPHFHSHIMAVQGPWGNDFGPLNLTPPLHELPRNSRKNFPKFYGDGKVHPDEHIVAFSIACGVIGVEFEDVVVRLFVETLQGAATYWFYHL